MPHRADVGLGRQVYTSRECMRKALRAEREIRAARQAVLLLVASLVVGQLGGNLLLPVDADDVVFLAVRPLFAFRLRKRQRAK